MTTGSRMKNRRKEIGVTAEEVATALGVSVATVYRYENGDIEKVPGSVLEPLSKVLRTTPAYLMGWDDTPEQTIPAFPNISAPPRLVRKPRLGTIACGKPILAIEDAEEFDEVPNDIPCDFTLRCQGDSMVNARIHDGDIVYIRRQEEVENGEIAAVRIGDEATLKRVYYNGRRIILRACNPLYEDLEFEGEALNHIEILGKAIAFTSMVKHTT